MKTAYSFTIGLQSFFKAIPFIFKHKMGWSFFIPLILGVGLFVLGFGLSNQMSGIALDSLRELFHWNDWSFEGAGYVVDLIQITVWLIVKLFFFLFFSYLIGYLMLILISPLLAYLSERTEEILTGETYPFKWDQFIRDITRGIGIAIRNFFIELGITIVLLLISFIPVVGLFTPFLLFAVSGYFYGYSFLDYNLERERVNAKMSLKLARKNAPFTASLGIPFALVLVIPYVGSILAGFAAIISAVAASMATHQVKQKGNWIE